MEANTFPDTTSDELLGIPLMLFPDQEYILFNDVNWVWMYSVKK